MDRSRSPLPGDLFIGATSTRRLRECGVTRHQQADPTRWKRYEHGLSVAADQDDDDPGVRIARAASLLRAGGAVGGWAASWMHGDRWQTGRTADGGHRPVMLCLPRRAKTLCHGDVEDFRSDLDDDDVVEIGGIAVTSLTRTAADLGRLEPLRHGVAALDGLRTGAQLDVASVVDWYERHPRRRGVATGVEALSLSRAGVDSPPETELRLLWCLDAKLPEPLVNPRVLHGQGRLLCRPDLFDPDIGLAGEYDGAGHATAAQRAIDHGRRDDMRVEGITTVVFVAGDLTVRKPRTIYRLRQAFEQARTQDRSSRRWYLAGG